MLMQIAGTFIAVAFILGLIILMGKMSEQGVDINKQFCTGDCSDCGLSEAAEELETCKEKNYNNLLTYERSKSE